MTSQQASKPLPLPPNGNRFSKPPEMFEQMSGTRASMSKPLPTPGDQCINYLSSKPLPVPSESGTRASMSKPLPPMPENPPAYDIVVGVQPIPEIESMELRNSHTYEDSDLLNSHAYETSNGPPDCGSLHTYEVSNVAHEYEVSNVSHEYEVSNVPHEYEVANVPHVYEKNIGSTRNSKLVSLPSSVDMVEISGDESVEVLHVEPKTQRVEMQLDISIKKLMIISIVCALSSLLLTPLVEIVPAVLCFFTYAKLLGDLEEKNKTLGFVTIVVTAVVMAIWAVVIVVIAILTVGIGLLFAVLLIPYIIVIIAISIHLKLHWCDEAADKLFVKQAEPNQQA